MRRPQSSQACGVRAGGSRTAAGRCKLARSRPWRQGGGKAPHLGRSGLPVGPSTCLSIFSSPLRRHHPGTPHASRAHASRLTPHASRLTPHAGCSCLKNSVSVWKPRPTACAKARSESEWSLGRPAASPTCGGHHAQVQRAKMPQRVQRVQRAEGRWQRAAHIVAIAQQRPYAAVGLL